ncbi:MAG TPA: serine/threonine-protein kinase, partial [Polyangiaceae bacterium]|nr:serine/threonine-protein kinase [Polyangiaceae bacterium]
MLELRPDVVLAGKLRLLRPLGEGGMGVVWAARHLALGSEVAVKFIRKERLATDSALLTRFEREARTLARITHPNVVRVMDFGSEGTTPYIVMELLEGYSLADLFERGGRLSLASVQALVCQVAGALAAAHDEGVVHRDIKPQNIFVTSTDPLCFKVLDFGVAKLLRLPSAPLSTELTETGVVIGSAPYMSPEQLEARGDVDPRSDLWSLGVIVYEALTGMRPFSGGSFVAVGAAVLSGQYQAASRYRAGLPEAIERWLAKILNPNVQQRFQSACELADAFPELHGTANPIDDGAKPGLHEPQPRSATFELALESAVTTVDHVPAVSNPHAGRLKWSILPAVLGSTVALGLLGVFGFNSRSLFATSASCPAGMQLIPRARFEMGSRTNADTPDDETTPGSANL